MTSQQRPPQGNRAPAGTSRRSLLRTGAAAAATFGFPAIITAQVNGANEKIRVASVGCTGKGSSDIENANKAGGEIVALCDVDSGNLQAAAKKHPDAKTFKDFRKLFDEMADKIDAVTVSTPDHCHGIIASTAMKLGKHVYCQKPLVQTVYEARMLRKLAKEKKLATQMGNQGSAEPGLRRAVEVVHAGLIGAVTEVHVWSNRPIWPQGIDRPAGSDPVPESLDWDLWLGPAQQRPYKKDTYHSFKWRGWYDFGTGALGDMACHTVNMPFRAVKMGYPTKVECEMASRIYPETFPRTSRIRFDFPERDGLPATKFWWYDGNPEKRNQYFFNNPLRPPAELVKEIMDMKGNLPISGALLVGEKGKIFSPDDYGSQFYVMLKDEKKYMGSGNHEAAKAIESKFTKPPGDKANTDLSMKLEWFKAIKDGNPDFAFSNFDIAAYLTEIILLGCIALRVGEGVPMDWDGPNMTSPNVPEAAKFVKRDSRQGWEVIA
jgi:Oxidoreductase family, NAD-binding Rossmann fold/Oxidoreductase family, C-terminal alpha/beta domain